MGKIPTSYDVHVKETPPVAVTSIGPVGPVTVAGIPDTYHINIDHLPKIELTVDSLPEIHLSVDKLPKIQFEVDPLEIKLTELPSIRGHLPADFCVGLSVLGLELLNVRLCGEAQIVTEPYHPNPCEVCGAVRSPDRGEAHR